MAKKVSKRKNPSLGDFEVLTDKEALSFISGIVDNHDISERERLEKIAELLHNNGYE